jgi:WD40 repeat protein
MSHRAPCPPRQPSLCAPWLTGALAGAVGLFAPGARPALTAGPPPKGGGNPGGAPTAREFLIPPGAGVIKDRQKPSKLSPCSHIQAGGQLTAPDGAFTFFVEPGGALTTAAGSQVVVVKKGGKVALGTGSVLLFYEKGAEVRGVERARVARAYDRITFRPFRPFTLRAAVTDARGRPAAGVKVHAFGLDGSALGTENSAADGTVTFRPKEGVATLAADFGPRWGERPPPGSAFTLDHRRQLGVLRGWEVALAEGSWCADGMIRLTHPGASPLAVRELRRFPWLQSGSGLLALSPGGRLLAAEREPGRMSLWDIDTGKELARVGPFKERVYGVAFSPDGALVALACQDGAVHVHRTSGGKKVHALRGHRGGVLCVAFAPDGRTLASGGEDGTVRLWDPLAGREKSRWQAHEPGVRCLAFSPDGKTLATCGDAAQAVTACGLVRLWDVATRRELRQFAVERGMVVFSPDGQSLGWGGAAWVLRQEGNAGTITIQQVIGLRDLATGGERLRRVEVGWDVAFTPDSRVLLSAAQSGTVTFWEVATEGTILSLPLPTPWAPGVTLAPGGGRVAAGQTDGTVRVWDLGWRSVLGSKPPAGPDAWEKSWAALAAADAAAAYKAIHTLASAGDRAVAFLGKRLRPAPARDLPLDGLIADLNSGRFAAREAATRALRNSGAAAESALRRALEKGPPLETRKRIEALLGELQRQKPTAEELRQLRAVQVLERVGTPAARRVLESLAGGWPAARQTREARAALARLAHKAAQVP